MCSDVDSPVFDYVVFEWLHVSMSLLEILALMGTNLIALTWNSLGVIPTFQRFTINSKLPFVFRGPLFRRGKGCPVFG